MPDVTETLSERGARYSDFTDHARVSDALIAIMESTPAWKRMSPVQRQATRVILDKFGRMAHGDPDYVDNWHDIQGYAKLVQDRLCTPKDTTPGGPGLQGVIGATSPVTLQGETKL